MKENCEAQKLSPARWDCKLDSTWMAYKVGTPKSCMATVLNQHV